MKNQDPTAPPTAPAVTAAVVTAGPLPVHLARLAAAGIAQNRLAPGQSHAKGLPPAQIPPAPGREDGAE